MGAGRREGKEGSVSLGEKKSGEYLEKGKKSLSLRPATAGSAAGDAGGDGKTGSRAPQGARDMSPSARRGEKFFKKGIMQRGASGGSRGPAGRRDKQQTTDIMSEVGRTFYNGEFDPGSG